MAGNLADCSSVLFWGSGDWNRDRRAISAAAALVRPLNGLAISHREAPAHFTRSSGVRCESGVDRAIVRVAAPGSGFARLASRVRRCNCECPMLYRSEGQSALLVPMDM
jgi:hypothetical protein